MDVVGLSVLYIAFGVVALWLLGELLLQHRAEPHWRVLALVGFLGLVAGVVGGSMPLVLGGVVAFGAGQYLVTRSVRSGAGTHWSLRPADGALPGLLGTVFPAGEPVAAVAQAPVLVGEVGPVEPAEQQQAVPEEQPAFSFDGYGQYPQTQEYEQQGYDGQGYSGSEYVQSERQQSEHQQTQDQYSPYQQSEHQQPAYQQPQYEQSSYQQPEYQQPEYAEAGYPQQDGYQYQQPAGYGYEQQQSAQADPYYGYQQQVQQVQQPQQPEQPYQHVYEYQYLPEPGTQPEPEPSQPHAGPWQPQPYNG